MKRPNQDSIFKFAVGQIVVQKDDFPPIPLQERHKLRRRLHLAPQEYERALIPKGTRYRVLKNIEALVTKNPLVKVVRLDSPIDPSSVLHQDLFETAPKTTMPKRHPAPTPHYSDSI